jgi:hypothetical protein
MCQPLSITRILGRRVQKSDAITSETISLQSVAPPAYDSFPHLHSKPTFIVRSAQRRLFFFHLSIYYTYYTLSPTPPTTTQPPGNAKTLRQHTFLCYFIFYFILATMPFFGYFIFYFILATMPFFGFKGGHDVVVWVRSRAPACKCTPSPSLPSVESPLHHSVSTSAIIARPLDGTMFNASCKATGPSNRQQDDDSSTTATSRNRFLANRRLLCDRRL